MCVAMCKGMCTDMCMDMCKGICIEIKICTGMCIGTCTDMYSARKHQPDTSTTFSGTDGTRPPSVRSPLPNARL